MLEMAQKCSKWLEFVRFDRSVKSWFVRLKMLEMAQKLAFGSILHARTAFGDKIGDGTTQYRIRPKFAKIERNGVAFGGNDRKPQIGIGRNAFGQ